VARLILAVVSPDNTPHGYNLTFAIPMVLFAVIAVVLYLLFSRPHRRVPATRIQRSAGSMAAAVTAVTGPRTTPSTGAGTASSADATGAARSASALEATGSDEGAAGEDTAVREDTAAGEEAE